MGHAWLRSWLTGCGGKGVPVGALLLAELLDSRDQNEVVGRIDQECD
jgi:hypothetical protein